MHTDAVQPSAGTADLADNDVSWLGPAQPAVVRLLERELDGRALVAGMRIASALLGGRQPIGDLQLEARQLHYALDDVRRGRCDRAMVRSLRAQIAEVGMPLTRSEEDAVATVIAALIWAVLDASTIALDDSLVA